MLHTFVDAALVVTDTNGIILSINNECGSMFGYLPNELTGKDVHVLMPPPYREQHKSYIERYMRTKVPKIIGQARIVQGQHKNGDIFDIVLTVKSVRQHNGETVFHGFMKKFLDSDVVITATSEGLITCANCFVQKEFSFGIDEVNGKLHVWDLFEPAQQALVVRLVNDFTKDVPLLQPRLLSAKSKQGQVFPVSVTFSFDAQRNIAIKLVRVHHKMEAVLTADTQGTIISANTMFLPVFGYDKSEIIGQNVAMLMPEPYAARHAGWMQHYQDTGHSRVVGFKRLLHAKYKDGTLFPIQLEVNKWEQGSAVYFSAIITRVRNNEPNSNMLPVEIAVRRIGSYLMCERIGKGSSCEVYLGRHDGNAQQCALKIIPKEGDWDAERVRTEVDILRSLQHPHVAALHEVIETPSSWCFVMELVTDGNLCDLLEQRNKPVNEQMARKIFRQLISCVAYLHERHVIHRDLKLENVMLDERGDIKLIDFGLAARAAPDQVLAYSCGTAKYAAPELLLNKPYQGRHTDVWAMGVVLYCVLCGSFPFADIAATASGTYVQPLHVSSECRDLFLRIFQPDPSQRASLQDIAVHPWVNQGHMMSPLDLAPLIPRTPQSAIGTPTHSGRMTPASPTTPGRQKRALEEAWNMQFGFGLTSMPDPSEAYLYSPRSRARIGYDQCLCPASALTSEQSSRQPSDASMTTTLTAVPMVPTVPDTTRVVAVDHGAIVPSTPPQKQKRPLAPLSRRV